ncbi:MAG: type II toxin-antitoxin system HicB family antitoxin [Armatimonadetes bacterium]|nr:type II toxin-antitoxin system HicB family antitoxin [Armatimonadota bacterium]
MVRTYTVVLLREEDGGFSVYVPALDAATQGDDVEEALYMARDMIEGFLAVLQEDGKPIPPDAESFTIDVAGVSQAIVRKVTVTEAKAVA